MILYITLHARKVANEEPKLLKTASVRLIDRYKDTVMLFSGDMSEVQR